LRYQCKTIVILILNIPSLQEFNLSVPKVHYLSSKQLMQFIRLAKLIDIAERVFSELVAVRLNTKTVQSINN